MVYVRVRVWHFHNQQNPHMKIDVETSKHKHTIRIKRKNATQAHMHNYKGSVDVVAARRSSEIHPSSMRHFPFCHHHSFALVSVQRQDFIN